MSSGSVDKELSTTSPADELFYKGKLLPLHFPPPLQMVGNILHDYTSFDQEFYSTPLAITAPTTPMTTTPFHSCNISPTESCQVSRELNPEEYLCDYKNENRNLMVMGDTSRKKSWARKLSSIKHSLISSKMKTSRFYLRGLFRRSGCSSESSASVAKIKEEWSAFKAKESLNKQKQATHENPPGESKPLRDKETFGKENSLDEDSICHRRSFSGVFKRRSIPNFSSSSSSGSSSSSSSSSSNLNGPENTKVFKRSSSTTTKMECPIAGAIAYCKGSQEESRSRRTLCEVGLNQDVNSSFETSKD